MTTIVSRHPGAVEWLRRRGITGPVIEHAGPEDVQGQDVVGILPLHLAALAASVMVIDMPGLAPGDRGKDLTPEAMDAAGARLSLYRVIPGPTGGELDPAGSGERSPLPRWPAMAAATDLAESLAAAAAQLNKSGRTEWAAARAAGTYDAEQAASKKIRTSEEMARVAEMMSPPQAPYVAPGHQGAYFRP